MVEGHRRGNEETGLSGGASFPLGMARLASPAPVFIAFGIVNHCPYVYRF